jgi:pimeloyl-ACP methyl ester carboxylesterase
MDNFRKVYNTEHPILPPPDSLEKIGNTLVEFRLPPKPVATLILLPGWDFSRLSWCQNSSLCSKALALQYRLVLPEMGKSIYHEETYKQTKPWILEQPSLKWVSDTLLPQLHAYGWDSQPLYVAGLSTGARGALALAIVKPQDIQAVALLSGDYIPSLQPKDKLNTFLMGPSYQFPKRWKKGPYDYTLRLDKLEASVYIGHGMEDRIVLPEHSLKLWDAISKLSLSHNCKVNFPAEAGHDYAYWSSETDAILNFFEAERKQAHPIAE